jgi:hypothetical protein
MIGRVTAFRIFEGEAPNGDPIKQLEVDLVTNQGLEYIKVNFNQMQRVWPTQGIALAKALTAITADDIVVIEPQRASKPNSFGSYNTFVNVDLWLADRGIRGTLQTDYDGQKFADIVDDVFDSLPDHPLYKDREQEKAEDEKSDFDFFNDYCKQKGFPLYADDPAGWLKVFNKWVEEQSWDQIASIDPEDDAEYWEYFKGKVSECKTSPLGAAKPAPKKGPAKADEYDPFK